MKRQTRTVILILLLAVVQLTAISTVPAAHAGESACPTGTTYDTKSGLCEGSSTCPAGFTNIGPKCDGYGTGFCPSGYTYEAVFDSCATCPAGTNFNPLAGNYCSAPAMCPPGFTNIGPKCDGYGTGYCPSGYTYEAVFDSCATCPAGTNFNPLAGNYCSVPAICPSGTTLAGAKCSDGSMPKCPAGTGTTFDKTYDVCSTPSTTEPYECEAGTYNDLGRMCQSIPMCPIGTTLTAPSYLCLSEPSFACLTTSSAGTLEVCLVIGHPQLTNLTSGLPPSPSSIGNPADVAFDSKGDLWVVDTSNSRVLEYAPPFSTGENASVVIGQTSLTGTEDSSPSGGLFDPTGLAFDSKGNLWVSDQTNNRILEFKAPLSTGELASLVLGQSTFGGYVGATTASGMNAPTYMAFDPSGNLWVTDQGNNRVLEFTVPFSIGEAASLVIGQSNFTGSSPATTATGLFSPVGIAFDSKGDLWVSDGANSRVLEYLAPLSKDEAASLVIGQPSFTTLGGGKVALNPYGIAFDAGGNLWITDGIKGVFECTVPFSMNEAVSTAIGQVSGSNSSSPGSKLSDPQGLAFDSGGNLWVADYGHGRVLEYSNANATATSTSISSSPSTSASGGGVPEFPYQVAVATIFTLLMVASYLLVRRRINLRGTT